MEKPDQQLLEIFRDLNNDSRDSLLAFAEFLLSRQPPDQQTSPVAVPEQPLDIPRPDEESVVAAIRRLRQTYPMIARSLVFNRSSELMSSHIIAGRDIEDVIDDLEELFLGHYQQRGEADDPS